MIDDGVHNFGEHIGRKLLFTAPHNKGITDDELSVKGIQRVSGWREVAGLLL
jgi:5'(3')-deoxyribonucleotidase